MYWKCRPNKYDRNHFVEVHEAHDQECIEKGQPIDVRKKGTYWEVETEEITGKKTSKWTPCTFEEFRSQTTR